ncbi:MAG: hypothetical protein N3A38_12915, partial [Planctomycetota bacterium]|nr:hypothetical protein [Planctomycetota bacterium]
AYGMARVPDTGRAAQKAIDFAQQAQHEYAAWDYSPNPDTNGRNDSSVSGWNVMALKSAKIGGLKVDHKGFAGAIAWLDAGQDLTGAKDAGSDYEGGKMAYAGTLQVPNKGNGSIAVTASAAMQRLFMGWKPDDPAVRGPANIFRKHLPKWDKDAKGTYVGTLNFYYWYYATLVMFQVGGDHWRDWNEAMKQALIPNQRRGGDEDGSWDPVGGGGIPHGGRVMSTALGCLCLEVYYRYLPMYR